MCDDSFSDTDAKVVCWQLGLNTSHAVSRGSAYYGAGSGRVWLGKVRCSGSESRLQYCRHSFWGNSDCSHIEDVGVDCSKLLKDPLMLFNYFIFYLVITDTELSATIIAIAVVVPLFVIIAAVVVAVLCRRRVRRATTTVYSGGSDPREQLIADGTEEAGSVAGFVPTNISGDTSPYASYSMATGHPGDANMGQ